MKLSLPPGGFVGLTQNQTHDDLLQVSPGNTVTIKKYLLRVCIYARHGTGDNRWTAHVELIF